MKKLILFMICGTMVFISCQKSNDHSQQNPTGADSIGKELLMRFTETWSSTDSFVTTFKYSDDGLLMEENSQSGLGFTHYLRDSKKRVSTASALITTNDTVFVNVHYIDDNSEMIAYTVSHATHSGPLLLDSEAYVYTGDKLTKISFYSFQDDTAFLNNYYTWAYDSKNNISQLVNYTRNNDGSYGYNIGYDFTYDDKPNPFYSNDPVRQSVKWYISSSPNNLVKQLNHYGNPPIVPDDYIGLIYNYDPAGNPGTSTRTGPAIGTSLVQSSYYYSRIF